MYGIDPDYIVFRVKKMKTYLKNKYGPHVLGLLKKIDGYESIEERKKRRLLVIELRKNGFSLSEIARLMNLSSQGVDSIIKKQGKYKIKIRNKNERQTRLFR